MLEVEGLDRGVAGRTLVKGAVFAIERGQRVALIGRNGAGKTTLLETLLGRREPSSGRVSIGHSVRSAYYSQQSRQPARRPHRLIEVVTTADQASTGRRRARCSARFLFSGEQVEKPVSALSGGERRRLALAQLVVSGANLLVLDEPTNHLDIESREALEDALEAFAGTLLLVSHDRALIEAIATRTLAIEDGGLTLRDGAFGEYARDHEPALDGAAKQAAPARPSASQPQAAARRRRHRSGRRSAHKREASRLEKRDRGDGGGAGQPSRRGSPSPTPTRIRPRWPRTAGATRRLQEELAYKYREWELRVEQDSDSGCQAGRVLAHWWGWGIDGHGSRHGRHSPRVLLVGLTPLVMDVLSGPLSDRADVDRRAFPRRLVRADGRRVRGRAGGHRRHLSGRDAGAAAADAALRREPAGAGLRTRSAAPPGSTTSATTCPATSRWPTRSTSCGLIEPAQPAPGLT